MMFACLRTRNAIVSRYVVAYQQEAGRPRADLCRHSRRIYKLTTSKSAYIAAAAVCMWVLARTPTCLYFRANTVQVRTSGYIQPIEQQLNSHCLALNARTPYATRSVVSATSKFLLTFRCAWPSFSWRENVRTKKTVIMGRNKNKNAGKGEQESPKSEKTPGSPPSGGSTILLTVTSRQNIIRGKR